MSKQDQIFHDLNTLYHRCGSWRGVAAWTGINRRTIQRWWAGSRTPSVEYRELVHAWAKSSIW